MIRIAVCDDLPQEREILISMLKRFSETSGISCEYIEFDSGEALLNGFSKGAYSLIFLDVYMDAMTGIEAARCIRRIDTNVSLIYTTTSREHGEDAFDTEAFHYLVKPFSEEKLFEVANKWYSAFCELRTVTFKCGRTSREVLVSDILFAEVQGRSCVIHTAKESIIVSHNLSELEEMLPAGQFCKPIRYICASMRHMRTVSDNGVLLDNGETVPVSRLEKESIRQELASYRLRAIRRR